MPRKFWSTMYTAGYRDENNNLICGSDQSLQGMGIPKGSTQCGCLVWRFFVVNIFKFLNFSVSVLEIECGNCV